MSYIDLNDLGSFASINALWAAYPEGGQEGDYCTIASVKYRWDKYDRMWVADPNFGPTPARSVTTFDGDVNMQNNLTVAGTIRAKGINNPCVGFFPTLSALEVKYPSPEVGWWAIVGDTIPGEIYHCVTEGVWTDSEHTGGSGEVDLTEYAKLTDVPNVVDSLTSGSGIDSLSARQGKVLKELIDDSLYETTEYGPEDLEHGDNGQYWILSGGIGATVDLSPATYGGETYSCLRLDVKDGDVITIATKGETYSRAWALTNKSRVIYAVAEENIDTTTNPVTITAVGAGYLYVNYTTRASASFSLSIKRNEVMQEIAELHDEVTTLSDAFEDFSDIFSKTYHSDALTLQRYWILSGGIGATVDAEPSSYNAESWGCLCLEVEKGCTITVGTKGSTYPRAWALTNKSRVIYAVAEENIDTTTNPVTITVQEDGYLYVNCNSAWFEVFLVNIDTDFVQLIDGIKEDVENNVYSPHYKNNPLPLWKDTLKVLAIGNSYTQDSTEYLGSFVQNANIPGSKLCLYAAIQSGATLRDWVNNYENNVSKTISRRCGSITMDTTEGTLQELLSQDWDVIILQQYSSQVITYGTINPDLTKMLSYIRRDCPNQKVSIAWHSVWSYKTGYQDAEDNEYRWEMICKTSKSVQHFDGIDIIIPSGTAIQNARHTSLSGDEEMTRDGLHLAYGAGRYIAAATWFQSIIAPMFNVSVLGNTTIHETPYSYETGGDFIAVDNSNRGLCQMCAFAATINNWNITEITDSTVAAESIAPNTPSIYDRVAVLEQGGGGGGVQSDWNETDTNSLAYIKNKPSLANVATSGNYNDLSNKPTIPDAQIQADWNQTTTTAKDYIKNKPTIPAAQVQSNWNESDNTSKAYIQNKPTIPAAQVNADWNASSGVAQILNKPTIPTVPTNVSAFTNDAGYLTSHQSIKTINSTSMVGSGNISLAEPVAVVAVAGATPTQTLNPNTFYKFTGAVTSLTLTLGSEVSGITNIFAFSFTAGADNPTITLPQSVTIADAPDIHSGDYVEFNIMDGKAVAKVWSA